MCLWTWHLFSRVVEPKISCADLHCLRTRATLHYGPGPHFRQAIFIANSAWAFCRRCISLRVRPSRCFMLSIFINKQIHSNPRPRVRWQISWSDGLGLVMCVIRRNALTQLIIPRKYLVSKVKFGHTFIIGYIWVINKTFQMHTCLQYNVIHTKIVLVSYDNDRPSTQVDMGSRRLL